MAQLNDDVAIMLINGTLLQFWAPCSLEALAPALNLIRNWCAPTLIRLQAKSEDPLEAPRFTVAVDQSLAADLAKSVGLDIHSYLKFA